jgi:putative transposase
MPLWLKGLPVRECGVLTLPDGVWAEAKRRRDVISELDSQGVVTRTEAERAAARLGISMRQVYKLLRRYRGGTGLVTDLAPAQSAGGKGKTRIPFEVENIIEEVIQTRFLSRQKLSVAVIVREISMRCKEAGHRPPACNTVRARIDRLDQKMVVQKRQGSEASRRLESAPGNTPEASAPLDVVQMDHTPMDVIVVEERSREPIGRPSLTLAIDTFTRCIVGMLLTFEAPSATSVGLCLAHAVMNKEAWLADRGLAEVRWAMYGKPVLLSVDNAPEFKSEALKRGCEQHKISLFFRPEGQPHYGGIIERVIGTAMKMAHEVPGTTFSNTKERGSYDSEAKASLTLRELEKWLTVAVCTYHESLHSTLIETPAACWKRSVQSSKIVTVTNEKAFLVDFLPVIRREVGRKGFKIDHVMYYSDVLKPWIACRDRLDRFVIRRDPRDLSRVWVLDPISKNYLEIPYRSISNPGVTLWEHRRAVQKLREAGRAQVDESAIFRMIVQRREIIAGAEKERKRARRDRARRDHFAKSQETILQVPDYQDAEKYDVKPFDDIEEW